MTVVSMLKLGKRSAVVAADERQFRGNAGKARKYDTAYGKVKRLGESSFIAYSGEAGFGNTVLSYVSENLPPGPDVRALRDVTKNAYKKQWDMDRVEYIFGEYGVTEEEFKKLKIVKGEKTWHDFILELVKNATV